MSKDVYPHRNLGDASEQWGREVEKRQDELSEKVERLEQKTRAVMRQSNAAVPGQRILVRSIDPSKLSPELWESFITSHDRSKYAVETVDGKNTVYRDPNPPPVPDKGYTEGDVWFQPDDNGEVTIWTWYDTPEGGEWRKEVVDEESISETIKQAIEDAQDQADFAVQAANGKNTNYTGPNEPTAPDGGFSEGDIWFDTSGTTTEINTWDGSDWVPREVSAELGPGSITSTHIADDAITTPKLAANAVEAGKIAAGAIQAGDGVIGSLDAGVISVGTLDADRIGANTITGSKILVGSVPGDRLEDGSITGTLIEDGAITTGKIAANTITAAKIAANAITAAKIATNAITATELSAGAITSKHTITGALFQTTATNNRGIKINSSGLVAYNASSQKTVDINANTGAVTITGKFISGPSNSNVTLSDNVSGWTTARFPGIQFNIDDGGGTYQIRHSAAVHASNTAGDHTFQGLHVRGPIMEVNPSALTRMILGRHGYFYLGADGGDSFSNTFNSFSMSPDFGGSLRLNSDGLLGLSGTITGNTIITGLGGNRSLSGDTREYVTVTYSSPAPSGSRRAYTTFRGNGKIIMGVETESGSSFRATVWNVHPSGSSTYRIGYTAIRV